MVSNSISLDEALDITRTGDVWLFRGQSGFDRAIRVSTNSPVNHVGMSVVIEDLPPLMWHAELGRSLPDMWSGKHQRGAQLHDMRDAVLTWAQKYGQQAWLRQLDHQLTGDAERAMEDAALRTIARLDGTPFPSSTRLVSRWVRGRIPQPRLPRRPRWIPHLRGGSDAARETRQAARQENGEKNGQGRRNPDIGLETAFCAEVVAVTYEAMELLEKKRRPNWYDPGKFWSGDDLDLAAGAFLGGEIAVTVPDGPARTRRR